jgi:hypothetical protein
MFDGKILVKMFHRSNYKADEPANERGAMWRILQGRHTLPLSRRGLTTFSCLVSTPKIVTRYLLSALTCQAHLTRNFYVSLWLLLVDIDQAWIRWRSSWERAETETLLQGNLICKEYLYIIRRWQTWMAEVYFLYLSYFGPRYTTVTLWSVVLTVAYHKETD